ncbi:signal transduction histidine kinase [Streptomyces sp. SLBN-118]|uniref:sensor histidine kinase n=1 Tax=Streptomyces sp. SLBN-118 TaxID=2768454 RepID=UPI001170E488|nr:histidine kinase [Streptomyces sp. SLBN-118]TQK53041.1 signal transduction histidine kinase [Streptomyces sp. SLBN-118]
MDASSRIRAGWAWLAAPELWSRRRTAGELVLALVLGLMAAGTEELLGSEGPRLLLVGASVALLSLLRRRMPTPVLVMTGALAPLLSGFAPLLMVVGWSAGRRVVGAGRTLAAFTVAYALFIGTTLVDSWAQHAQMTMVLLSTLYFLATTVVPGLASRYWTQRRTLLHTLQERNAQLLRERAMVAGQARLLERQRIAQDMHDSLGHQLALISVHTGALEVDPELTPRQREVVGVLRDGSVTAMHELREVVGILRDGVEAPPPVDESGRAARGTAGIAGLVEAARAAGNTVELRCSGEARPLAAAGDHAAYRIAQEALTNAYKHAPGAAIGVELRYEPDSFVVEVVSGAAAAPAPGEVVSGGQGLTGLRERARLVGGIVHAGPADDGGFRVAGVLPYGVVEAAPFVATEDDFRQQSPKAALGNGGPVMNWTVSERELAMGGQNRSRGGGLALGCGISVAALLVLGAAGVFGLFFLVGSMSEGMIDPVEYEKVTIGAPEDEVRDGLPSGDTIATAGLSGKGPEKPVGSECLVLMSSEVGDNLDTEPVFRFCFKDGKLIEKKSYEVSR